MKYKDIDDRKKAFVFELDNVIYPEKDYLYQVYYLFSSFLEYTELINAKEATELMIAGYLKGGEDTVFNAVKEKYALNEKYLVNFHNLMLTVKLPLKLLVYERIMNLMQEIVVDRKKIFIVTNGNPVQQLNKIKQTEWNGLESYLTCYFADEIIPKPEPDVIDLLIKEHNLQRRDILLIENTETDRLCATASGVDCLNVNEFL